MKKVLIIFIVSITILFTSCSPNGTAINPWKAEQKVYGFSFIEGEVLEIFANKVIVQLEDKNVVEGDEYQDILTNKIIKQSMFVKGMSTSLGKEAATVEDIRGTQITFNVKSTKLNSGDSIKIYIPKKTIAIMDFSLIGMEDSGINKFAMEDMTTRMVQSGQYVVVERAKLNSLLKEQELADSGLLDESASSKIGKLVSADIILTGSFAKQGNQWNVNLRLVDVATGIILSAINEKIGGDEFRPKQITDSSNLTENFEDDDFSIGWNKNIVNKNGAQSQGQRDEMTGANGTESSYRIDYLLTKERSLSIFINKRLRDISKYEGIKLYAKASKYTTVDVKVRDQNFDDTASNIWKSEVNAGENWQEFRVPFNTMTIGRDNARKNPGGDGWFDKDNVVSIIISVTGRANIRNQEISLWIDEISFY